jgi:hypothetical protein
MRNQMISLPNHIEMTLIYKYMSNKFIHESIYER